MLAPGTGVLVPVKSKQFVEPSEAFAATFFLKGIQTQLLNQSSLGSMPHKQPTTRLLSGERPFTQRAAVGCC